MTSIRAGDNGGGHVFDPLAQFYVSVAIIWTTTLLVGCTFLVLNRHEQCIRIRNLLLALSAVTCLHVYWVLCMVAYSMGEKYPCAAEYWIMSIYFPFGIALFQANSMQLLRVFGIQEKLLFAAQRPYRPPFLGHAKPNRRHLTRWKQMDLVQRTEVSIVVGMIVQVSAARTPTSDVLLFISQESSYACRSRYSSLHESSKHLAPSPRPLILKNVGEVLNGKVLTYNVMSPAFSDKHQGFLPFSGKWLGLGYLHRTFYGRFAISTTYTTGDFRSLAASLPR